MVAVGVVVQHPGGQGDRGIQQGIADGLGSGGLFQEVPEAGGAEAGQRVGGGVFLFGFGWLGAGQGGDQEVEVDPGQPGGGLAAHGVGDRGADIAALGDIAAIAQAVHEGRPGVGDAGGVPAEFGRLPGESVAGQRRQHQVKGVAGVAAMGGGVGQGADGLQQLDHRARPAVGHDQRQRPRMRRPHMEEVDLDPVDLGQELGQGVQPGLDPSQVIVAGPVAGQRLQGGQLHPLGPIGHQLLRRPPHPSETPPQVIQCPIRNLDAERANGVGGQCRLLSCLSGRGHDGRHSRVWRSLDQREDGLALLVAARHPLCEQPG